MDIPPVVLASASERRRELLQSIGIAFDVLASGADESFPDGLPPERLTCVVSQRKCAAVVKDVAAPAIIIGADTIVFIDGMALGKPKDVNAAFHMLKKLQGRTHTVYTGVSLIHKKDKKTEMRQFVNSAHVTMRRLTDDEIWAYVNTKEPLDKAGSYAVQGKGALLVEKINGDFYTVVGLPLSRLYVELKDMGFDIM